MVMRRQHVGENLLLALDTLRTHKFRSFLTLLGVLIGTTTVIAVASIITGLDQQLVDMAEQWGTRLLWVYKLQLGTPHRLTREERLRKPLTFEDARAIKEECPAAETVAEVSTGDLEQRVGQGDPELSGDGDHVDRRRQILHRAR